MTVSTAPRSQTAETAECKCATDALAPVAEVAPVTVAEVVAMLRCSREYLYAGLRERRFPGTQVGRSWKMPGAFVQGFVRDVLNVGGQMSFEDYAAEWRAKNEEKAAS